jgi:ABC transporter
VDLDVDKLDKNIDRMMPELGFSPEDNDRLVASYSGGWQMRMCLGKILLQQPDLLLLDEPTNHLDLEAIEWLEGAASLTCTMPWQAGARDVCASDAAPVPGLASWVCKGCTWDFARPRVCHSSHMLRTC